DLLNPVRSAEDTAGVERFRLEPYVIPADVYSQPPHTGRGGWSWYTGSAGWVFRVGFGTIFGFGKHRGQITLAPRIPSTWPGFSITLRHGMAVYHIEVRNDQAEPGIDVDGQRWTEPSIPLADDGQSHTIAVRLPSEPSL